MVKILSILVAFLENMNFSRPVKIKHQKQVAKQQITCCISMLSASIIYQDFKTSHFFFHRLRCLIHWIVTKKIFDLFIMFVIVLSSLALASEDPVQENSEHNKILGFADYWFTAIFTLECSLKVHQKPFFCNIPVHQTP